MNLRVIFLQHYDFHRIFILFHILAHPLEQPASRPHMPRFFVLVYLLENI